MRVSVWLSFAIAVLAVWTSSGAPVRRQALDAFRKKLQRSKKFIHGKIAKAKDQVGTRTRKIGSALRNIRKKLPGGKTFSRSDEIAAVKEILAPRDPLYIQTEIYFWFEYLSKIDLVKTRVEPLIHVELRQPVRLSEKSLEVKRTRFAVDKLHIAANRVNFQLSEKTLTNKQPPPFTLTLVFTQLVSSLQKIETALREREVESNPWSQWELIFDHVTGNLYVNVEKTNQKSNTMFNLLKGRTILRQLGYFDKTSLQIKPFSHYVSQLIDPLNCKKCHVSQAAFAAYHAARLLGTALLSSHAPVTPRQSLIGHVKENCFDGKAILLTKDPTSTVLPKEGAPVTFLSFDSDLQGGTLVVEASPGQYQVVRFTLDSMVRIPPPLRLSPFIDILDGIQIRVRHIDNERLQMITEFGWNQIAPSAPLLE